MCRVEPTPGIDPNLMGRDPGQRYWRKVYLREDDTA